LYSLKVLWPQHIHLLRGNHESAMMSEQYGFSRECCVHWSRPIYDQIVASFNQLPIAALLDRNFCVHGGISPKLRTRDDVLAIPKLAADFGDDVASDLVWSDPRDDVDEFDASPRGCGMLFGEEAVRKFVDAVHVDRVIRAHESCPEGFDWPFGLGTTVLTLFSSCDYCESMNDAAVAIVRPDGDIQCRRFPPLSRREAGNRRVTIPEWALEERDIVLPPELPTLDVAIEITV
jgi:diadenosine tetraphosphatase ApaH/serine/threonine PP2A family protein phosphatase